MPVLMQKELAITIGEPKVSITIQLTLLSYSLKTDLPSRLAHLSQAFLKKFMELNQIEAS